MTIAGQAKESEAAFRQAMTIKQKLADDNPAVTEFRNDLALSHRNLGEVLSQTGRTSESEAEYRKALTIYRKLAEENPTVSEFRGNLADGHSSLAFLLHRSGQTAESQVEFKKALTIRQKLADDSPAVTKIQADLAASPPQSGIPSVRVGQAVGGGSGISQGSGDLSTADRERSLCYRISSSTGEQPP